MSKLMTYSMVSVLIILITAFLLFTFQSKIKDAYAEATAKQTCKASVKAHTLLKSGEIKCPTVKLTINNKDENIIKKKIADAMFDCWDEFLKGKEELFSDDNVYCHICHRITFDKKIKVNGFMNYIATKNAPGQKISYLQFLTTEKTQNSEVLKKLENKKIEDSIDASKNNEYAIIFTYIKGKKDLEEYVEKAKYFAPGAGLTFIGLGLIYYSPGIAVAVASIPVVGPLAAVPAGGITISVGTITFGIGLLWDYLALKYAGVPFEHIALISFIPYDAQSIQNLNCKELPIKQ